MDPDIIQDHPGDCPKCGMKLTAMSHENHGDKRHSDGMEGDFRRRFFITLPLVLSTMLLSANIQKWLGFSLQFKGIEVVLFILGTIIFFFGGIPFFQSAKGELKAKNPGMMTLVAFAITVG